MARTAQFLPNDSEVTVIDYETDQEQPKTDADKRTDDIAAALSDDPESFLNVSRQTQGGNSPMEFVGRFPADKFDYGQLLTHLQKTYGHGDYRCMLYAKGKVRANKLLSIAAPLVVDNSTQGTDQLSLVLREFQKMQTQMMQIMQAQNNGASSRKEMLEEMLMYKQLFGNDNRPASGMKDIIDTVAGLKELGINIGGEKEEDGFGKLIDRATPLLEAAFTSQQNAQQAQQKTPPIPTEPNNMNFLIKSGVKTLINAAAKQSDAGNYAQLIVDQFSPAQIQNFFGNVDGFKFIQSIDPRVVQYKPWFDDLAEHVKAIMGWPSKYTDLYADPEGDNLGENDAESSADGANHL